MKQNITNIISWVLLALGIIFLLWKIIGGSPTEFSIIMTFLAGIIFNLMSVNSKVSRTEEKAGNLENKFNSLAKDFKEHIKHR
ncbi:hypothetical protein HYV89_03015 [Candidatus Woesearchaeota archaeon]|nr:hypothetical protein [Candidatus Woesearchaeota archaeon]